MEFTLILIGCFLFVHTYIGSDWASHYSADPVGTAAMPRFYLVLLVICSFLIVISKNKKSQEIGNEERKKGIPSLNLLQTIIFYLFALTAILYIYATWYIGLFITTLTFLLVWLYVFGNDIKRTLIFSIIGTIAIYLLMNLAQVFFPDGLLF
jgi:magnesium-transporting ATPase (P-type)